ncbi:cytochrome P450 [Hyaloscypha variabilis F]|uniref:Cytochrome P450 n=1 Tax=Hyaloscypha variabilis (strain UAMH 11265 / GT02V1 / F) TaxID=1149755 RepID=A0A2J6SDW0_HYAVF|nr:cytochrome P450 [Hyaloscypha variabilis F]
MGVIVEGAAQADASSLLQRIGTLQWDQLALIAAGLLAIHTISSAYIFSPVRHIPGPWYARVSRIPLLWATFQRRRTPYATALLERYGPIVVIAPDQVHTTDEEAMKIIYDRTSLKTPFYSSMGSWKGVTSTLGFVDYANAAPHRNNLIQCFQNKNLAILATNIDSHVQEFVRLLSRKAEESSNVDGIVVFRLLALDIVTDVLWGEEQTLLSHLDDSTPDLLRRFHAFSTWNALKSFLPGADTIVRLFGTKKWKQLRNDCSDMDITAREALDRWNNNESSRHERDVLSMLKAMDSASDPKKRLPNSHIPAYMVEMLAAGSSTTSHTAAFTCWLLARNQDAADQLYTELQNAFPDPTAIDPRQVMDLPFLDACIRETMRMYPMIPGPLERILGKPLTVSGYNVPAGVVASTAAFNQGRLPDVYTDPDTFNPGRWLKADDRMRLNWTPFGYGSRACPGSNLAMTELKYMLGSIFRQFRSVLHPDFESDVLEMADVFAAGSKSGHCWLRFEKIE